ncbi:MAG: TonB-dependent receptor [Longimicrobiales bacterium]
MRSSARSLVLHVTALALLAAPLPLVGQQAEAGTGPGRLAGHVTDPGGQPLAGVAVTIPSLDRSVLTDSNGDYGVAGIAPGSVVVEFEGLGRRSLERSVTVAPGVDTRLDVSLEVSALDLDEISVSVVTARRVEEVAQDVPIPLAVVSGRQIERSGAVNIARLQQSVPTVQFFTTNPRNSFLNVRGLGLPFGLTNDGIDTGVGIYIDGVFLARPASATLDFNDLERIEVLRGPQGTLYGKNTTSGALNLTTRAPSLTASEVRFEGTVGNLGYVQTKGSLSTPFADNLAGRLSFVITRRDGTIRNVATNEDLNTLNNVGVKGQLRFLPSQNVVITASGDYVRQRPNGYAQVPAGIADNLANPNRRFPAIAADLGYTLPSLNPFDRVVDQNTPWRSDQDFGGASLHVDADVGPGRLTSTSAWRYWNWGPSNDRDWTGLNVTRLSQAPSTHHQYTQEVRYAVEVSPRLDFVIGAFGFRQHLDGRIVEQLGSDAWRWSYAPNPLGATPGILDGYGGISYVDFNSTSAALFGQAQVHVTDRLTLLPGLRYNYDVKGGTFDRQITDNAFTSSDPAVTALENSYKNQRPQFFEADTHDTDLSGQLTLRFEAHDRVNAYGTYATSFKSVGFNLGALPTVGGQPDLSLVRIEPEDVRHIEIGLKTTPFDGVTANFNVFDTEVRNYQTNVQSTDPSLVRGYLANAELVTVRGAEFDGNAQLSRNFTLYGAVAYSDGKHARFTNAPVPIHLAGGSASFVDISGSRLPGLSKWAASGGSEYFYPLTRTGELSVGVDAAFRSAYSSSTSPSPFLRVDAYTLVNARIGFQSGGGWGVSVWSRNLFDKDYLEQLGQVAGTSGLYWGVPGDPRTFGVTLRRGT